MRAHPHSPYSRDVNDFSTTVRVLVAEDDGEVRRRVVDMVQSSPGLELAATAADGVAALQAFEASNPDVVLLDLQMPGMSGLAVLERIRATDAAVPVVIFSASDSEELRRRCQRAGGDAFVSKTSEIHTLPTILATVARARTA